MISPDTPHDFIELDFDNLVLSGHGAVDSGFGNFHQATLEDLQDPQPSPPGEHERVLQLRTHELLAAINAVGVTIGSSSDGGDLQVALVGGDEQPAHMLLETTCLAGTCRYEISATDYGIQPAPGREPVRFRANHRQFRALVQLCQGRCVELRLRFDRMRMTIVIDGRLVHVPVWPAWPESENEDVHGPRQAIVGDELSAVMAYLGIFAERDDIQTKYSVASLEAGRAASGSQSAIGRAQVTRLSVPDFAIHPDSLDVLTALTVELEGQYVSFIGTSRGYELSNGRLHMKIPKSSSSFPTPALDSISQKGAMLVNRAALRDAVERLRLTGASEVTITLPATSNGDCRIHLAALTASHDKWTEAVICKLVTAEVKPGWHGAVPFGRLLGVLKHFDSANVELSYEGSALAVLDEALDGRLQLASLLGRFAEQQPEEQASTT